ncbi:hypothetical protein Fot_21371 [Forsythia ovata]|uniref:Uncharacterized protein n=1 Tax=Forsythia ovata TaxID=205694 RepID=A0ABD1UW91_9LAMI
MGSNIKENTPKLFKFILGLQACAHAELRQQGVKDLTLAIATANCLIDFKLGSSYAKYKKSNIVGRKLVQKMVSRSIKRARTVTIPNQKMVIRPKAKEKTNSIGCFIAMDRIVLRNVLNLRKSVP